MLFDSATSLINNTRAVLPGRSWHEAFVVASDSFHRARNKHYEKSGIGFVVSGCFDYRSETGSAVGVPGSVLFGNAGEEFSVHHLDSSGNRRLVIWYDPVFLEEVAGACGVGGPRFRIPTLPPGRLASRIFANIRALMYRSDDRESSACDLACTALMLDAEPGRVRSISNKDRRQIVSIVRFIESNFQLPCSVDRLAEMAGLSRYHFMRVFKIAVGQSVNQYVINTRLRAAAIRITESKESVFDIALGVGFHDISHFNACFRSVFGCSPRQMRQA